MKKWMALFLALAAVLTLAACGKTAIAAEPLLQPKDGWGKAAGFCGEILGVWYNVEENAGNETVYGFRADGVVASAKDMDATEGYLWYYIVDEESKTVSVYEQNNKEGEASLEEQLGALRATLRIVENGESSYLIGENAEGEPVGMAREADLEAARAAYPELADSAE